MSVLYQCVHAYTVYYMLYAIYYVLYNISYYILNTIYYVRLLAGTDGGVARDHILKMAVSQAYTKAGLRGRVLRGRVKEDNVGVPVVPTP